MNCNCYYCKTHRELHQAHREYNVEKLYKIAEELGGRLLNAEFDSDYRGLVLAGEWPDSVRILTLALEKAKAKKLRLEATRKVKGQKNGN